MPIRVAVLWHMHQPFYKDLVTGEYRLPWVRMHALKDYYGMVKLLDEFPNVRQTFNLVPSLIAQLQDYVAGTARDPFLDVATKPVRELTQAERRFALQYLFQANATNLIGRYPRYHELYEQFRGAGADGERAEPYFVTQDYTDLQVLSQIAWFDEFFLEDREVAALIEKGRSFTEDDQRLVIAKEKELLAKVLPAYQDAAQRGAIEISTSPFYHPILPLLCDSDAGAQSSPGLPLPRTRFQHPEDAREQLQRGLELHKQVFGITPRGVWPSEGSVSDEVLEIAHSLGVEWLASDEGVLGRSLNIGFARDEHGILQNGGAEALYKVYRWEKRRAAMNLFFRDHALSDLIGFVYSGMDAAEAAQHLVQRIKDSAQPLLSHGNDPVVPIILDGENAWEFYPRSGREFLRRFYSALQHDPEFEAVTISEAIARQKTVGRLKSLAPGSWINANFNVWIGAPEDNRSWDYLADAREFLERAAPTADKKQLAIAREELLIAEGSDWNWWYGPEHHSANDRDFDELYRKHLSNIYTTLGGEPPEYLAQPIAHGADKPYFVPQTGYIHPHIEGAERYFDWVGAAMYTAERTSSAMHGQRFYLEAVHAGIDETNLYARLTFLGGSVPDDGNVVFAVEALPPGSLESVSTLHLHVEIADRKLAGWRTDPGKRNPAGEMEAVAATVSAAQARATATKRRAAAAVATAEPLGGNGGEPNAPGIAVAVRNSVDVQVPLRLLKAETGGKLRLRASLWRDKLPVDALPLEGSIELDVLSEQDLEATGY